MAIEFRQLVLQKMKDEKCSITARGGCSQHNTVYTLDGCGYVQLFIMEARKKLVSPLEAYVLQYQKEEMCFMKSNFKCGQHDCTVSDAGVCFKAKRQAKANWERHGGRV